MNKHGWKKTYHIIGGYDEKRMESEKNSINIQVFYKIYQVLHFYYKVF